MPTGQSNELKVDTREYVQTYNDAVTLFTGSNISVADPNQPFTVIIRRASGGDTIVGELDPGQSLVLQFKEVLGPSPISNS